MKSATTCFKLLVLLAGGLLSTHLLAQELEEEGEQLAPLYTSSVELGVDYSSQDSLKFGEYNGLQDEGGHVIGNITLRKYSEIGNNTGNFWELTGTNLGLDNRSIYGVYSHDGTYGNFANDSGYSIYFRYDQIPHNQFNGWTPFIGAGSATQTLPANWVAGSSTGALTNLIPDLNRITVQTDRKRFGGGFSWIFNDHLKLKANFRHEIKEGSDPLGAVFGSTGGNPRSSVLARAVDYDMNEFNASLTYETKDWQNILSYTLSLFNNNNKALRFTNPYDYSSWAPGSNYSDGAVGQIGYEPSNQAFTVNYQGGYNFNPATRATVNISYGQMTQNQAFLPYSSVFPAVVPLPRNSLDGEIDTLHANVNGITRFGRHIDLRLRYTYDNQDNKTPRNIYLRIPGDATTQGTPTDSNARVNWPYSTTTHTLNLDADYRFQPMMTKLGIGYTFQSKSRDFSETSTVDEHTFHAKLSATPLDTVNAWFKYSYSSRDGQADPTADFMDFVNQVTAALGQPYTVAAGDFSNYWNNHPALTGHNKTLIEETINNFLAGVAAGDTTAQLNSILGELFENNPMMRKYYQADRKRNQVSGTINFYPNDAVTYTLTGHYNEDDYNQTTDGLTSSRNADLTLDTSYRPSDKVSTYAYLTYENNNYKQRGFYHPGFAGALTPWTNLATMGGTGWWSQDITDNIYSIGGGLDWQVIKDKLRIKLDYMYSYGNTSTITGAENPVVTPFLPLPDVTTRLSNVSLTGDYQAKKNITIRFKYAFEHFNSSDFALDNVGVNTLANVILLGNTSPNYNVHVVGVSFIYKFQNK